MRHVPLLLILWLLSATAFAACPPPGYSRESLATLRANAFALADDAARNALAIALLDCLDAPDPALRDGIAFEALSTWLRGGQLDTPTRARLLSALQPMLQPTTTVDVGFRRPFAALVLSEVARTDRVSPWLDAPQREALVTAATQYLISVDDYRGFDDHEGWRHGVAHGSDLLLQLVLNPALDAAQLDRMLMAITRQIAPPGEHTYVFGEPERLARPVLYAALRDAYTAQRWQAWFAAIASPAPLPDWGAALQSRAGLARRHNLRAFLSAIYVESRDSEDPKLAQLAPLALAALQGIP